MKDRVEYQFTINRRDYTPEYLMMWAKEAVDLIKPDAMQISTCSTNFWKCDTDILFDEIRNEGGKKEIDVHLRSQDESFSTYVRDEDDRVMFSLFLLKENQKIEGMVEDAMCKGWGIFAFKHPSLDVFFENTEDVSYYLDCKGSLKGKVITCEPGRRGKKIIAVEHNAGHHHVEEGLYFGAYHCMWFGRDYYEYIPKEKLRAFSDCHENVELENDVIRIMLYEDVWDCEKPANRKRQWVFRRSVGIDQVAHSLHVLKRNKKKVTDTIFQTLEPDENGNGRTCFFYTTHGKNVRKSEADVAITYTYSKNVKIREERSRMNCGDGGPQPYLDIAFTYAADGKLLREERRPVSSGGGKPKPIEEITYVYSKDGRLLRKERRKVDGGDQKKGAP